MFSADFNSLFSSGVSSLVNSLSLPTPSPQVFFLSVVFCLPVFKYYIYFSFSLPSLSDFPPFSVGSKGGEEEVRRVLFLLFFFFLLFPFAIKTSTMTSIPSISSPPGSSALGGGGGGQAVNPSSSFNPSSLSLVQLLETTLSPDPVTIRFAAEELERRTSHEGFAKDLLVLLVEGGSGASPAARQAGKVFLSLLRQITIFSVMDIS